MVRHWFLFLLLSMGFVSASGFLNTRQQAQFLRQMTDAARTMENFRADFVQQRHLSVLSEPLRSQGICFFEAPDKLRWELTAPFRTVLIYNASRVAKFEMEKDHLRKMNFGGGDMMRKVLKQIISWMQGDFNSAEGIYDLRIEKGAPAKLELIPKSEKLRQSLHSIQLFVHASTYRVFRVRIQESDTDYIQIDFKHMAENLGLPPALFDTNHPDLVK